MSVNQQLILHIYAPVTLTGKGRVYSAAGDGYGPWRLDEFYLKRDRDILELTWQQQGNYVFPDNTVQLHFHGVEVQQAWVDGQEVNFPENCLEIGQFQRVCWQGKMTANKA